MEVQVSMEPALTLGTPTRVVDCGELGLFEGYEREFEIDVDGSRFLWVKSAVPVEGRIDVGITVVENWALEFAQ